MMQWQTVIVEKGSPGNSQQRFEELRKRCTIPFYEEAHRIVDAVDDPGHLITDPSQGGFYLPDNLRRLVEQYEKEGYIE